VKGVALLVALCGCNQVFDLHATQLRDVDSSVTTHCMFMRAGQ
jgi:hypothetical protein